MKSKTAMILMMTVLAAACGRQQTNSEGNGPGNADGVGGRQDPATAPATDVGAPAPADEASSTETSPPAGQPGQ
jgi:hypothetical protein